MNMLKMVFKIFVFTVFLTTCTNTFAFRDDDEQALSDKKQETENMGQQPAKSLYYEKNSFINNMRRERREFKRMIYREKYEMQTEYKRL